MPLFKELRAYEFGVVRITRPHKEFPARFIILKNRFATKLEQNTLFARVINNTLCLAWQDNNIILALSNIYIIYIVKNFREKVKKRPIKTLINSRII